VVSHGATKTIPEPAWAAASPDIMAFDRGVGVIAGGDGPVRGSSAGPPWAEPSE
jgi:hypothetical protein